MNLKKSTRGTLFDFNCQQDVTEILQIVLEGASLA